MISVTAAAFVSAAPRLWQDPAEPEVPGGEGGRGGWASPAPAPSSQRRHFPSCSAANGSSGVYINQQLENGWLEGKGRGEGALFVV